MSAFVSTITRARIIAVPLTRPHRSTPLLPSTTPTRLNRLTYYQFQLNVKTEQRTLSIDSEKKSWFGWPQEGIIQWASRWASNTWAGFGKQPGGWKPKLYHAGEKLVDRLDFEELALKSIDPSLGPTIPNLIRGRLKELGEIDRLDREKERLKIPLLYPPSILSSSAVLAELLTYTEFRISKHRRGFYLWMSVAPLTAPFMVIPIIPNIPFFFCAWRSWSHYRAYRSSQYLRFLLQRDLILPESNDALDSVYKSPSITSSLDPSPSVTSNTSDEPPSPLPQTGHELLITRDTVPFVTKALEIADGSTAAADLYRAADQARLRVERGYLGP